MTQYTRRDAENRAINYIEEREDVDRSTMISESLPWTLVDEVRNRLDEDLLLSHLLSAIGELEHAEPYEWRTETEIDTLGAIDEVEQQIETRIEELVDESIEEIPEVREQIERAGGRA